MLYAIFLTMTLCVACVAVALIPHPQTEPSVRLPKAVDRPTALMPLVAARRWTNPFAPLLTLIGRLTPGSGSQWQGLRDKLSYVRSPVTAEGFVGMKAVGAVLVCVTAVLILREFEAVTPLPVVLAAGVGFMLPDFWLRGRLARRQRAVIRLLPEAIDLLTLCVGAGLDFLGALNKVVAVKAFKKEPLVEELSVVLQEIKLGKRRFESLKAMAKRVNMPEVTSFVRTLVQADRMGTPIGEVLAIHSEDVRFQRFNRAERAALKAPMKILIPLIFFIMPCVLLIVCAPIILQFVKGNLIGNLSGR